VFDLCIAEIKSAVDVYAHEMHAFGGHIVCKYYFSQIVGGHGPARIGPANIVSRHRVECFPAPFVEVNGFMFAHLFGSPDFSG
jgi:hypothetical protein